MSAKEVRQVVMYGEGRDLRDVFETIHQAMCEVVSGIYLPRVMRAVVWCF